MARVVRYDSGFLQAPRKTSQGFLRVDGYASRCGVLEYRDGLHGVRRELRLPEDVFAGGSLEGFEGLPVTDDHPHEMVDADNSRVFARGTVLGVGRRDGDRVAVSLIVQDLDLIHKMERGKRQLSVGYNVELDETPGEHPTYGKYDAIQRKIEPNHLAVVDRGRAGGEVCVRMDGADVDARVWVADWDPDQPREEDGKFGSGGGGSGGSTRDVPKAPSTDRKSFADLKPEQQRLIKAMGSTPAQYGSDAEVLKQTGLDPASGVKLARETREALGLSPTDSLRDAAKALVSERDGASKTPFGEMSLERQLFLRGLASGDPDRFGLTASEQLMHTRELQKELGLRGQALTEYAKSTVVPYKTVAVGTKVTATDLNGAKIEGTVKYTDRESRNTISIEDADGKLHLITRERVSTAEGPLIPHSGSESPTKTNKSELEAKAAKAPRALPPTTAGTASFNDAGAKLRDTEAAAAREHLEQYAGAVKLEGNVLKLADDAKPEELVNALADAREKILAGRAVHDLPRTEQDKLVAIAWLDNTVRTHGRAVAAQRAKSEGEAKETARKESVRKKHAKNPTFSTAREVHLEELGKQGWQVSAKEATSPDGRHKLYFGPQGIKLSTASGTAKHAKTRATAVLVDTRKVSTDDLIRNVTGRKDSVHRYCAVVVHVDDESIEWCCSRDFCLDHDMERFDAVDEVETRPVPDENTVMLARDLPSANLVPPLACADLAKRRPPMTLEEALAKIAELEAKLAEKAPAEAMDGEMPAALKKALEEKSEGEESSEESEDDESEEKLDSAQLAALENARKDAELALAAAEKARKDAIDQIPALVRARVALETQAASVLGAGDRTTMSDREVKLAVIKRVDGDDYSDAKYDDSYVAAMFDGACKRAAKGSQATAAVAATIAANRADAANAAAEPTAVTGLAAEHAASEKHRNSLSTAWTQSTTTSKKGS